MANRIRFRTAAQVLEAFPAVASDLGEASGDILPLEHLAELARCDDLRAAVTFAALCLPRREAVWWGCLAIRGMGRMDIGTREGVRLAEAWVRRPEEEERRAAGEFAQSEYFDGPGAWIAFAAFTTGGSLASAGLQAVPPPPEMAGRAVATAVMLAANRDDASERLVELRTAIESARDFATGGDGKGPWERRADRRRERATAAPG